RTATPAIYTLSLHDALPISKSPQCALGARRQVENKVAGDGERGSRQQRQEIDHRSTRVGSGGLMLLNARRPRAARAPDDSGEWPTDSSPSGSPCPVPPARRCAGAAWSRAPAAPWHGKNDSADCGIATAARGSPSC